jgi:glycerol-3-phosphate acyltransferase PlsY
LTGGWTSSPLVLLLSYLVGSIPFGLFLARAAGIDVRGRGSGNIGAANVARNAGAWLGLATLAADAAKGAIPVLVARALGAGGALVAAAGVSAVLGHCFPVALRFAGGKGVATALGAIVALAPCVALVCAAVFVVAFGLTRRVSVGSVLGALAAPAAALLFGEPRAVTAACAAMAAVIFVRHLGNLGRLRRGTEPRFALPKRQAPPGN